MVASQAWAAGVDSTSWPWPEPRSAVQAGRHARAASSLNGARQEIIDRQRRGEQRAEVSNGVYQPIQ
jgi:hypothetical protein